MPRRQRKSKRPGGQPRLNSGKVASNERIKLIEAKVTLNTEELKFKTEIVKSAFESINTSIDSTGKLLGDLWKLMDNPSMTFSDKWALEDQIEKENALREKASATGEANRGDHCADQRATESIFKRRCVDQDRRGRIAAALRGVYVGNPANYSGQGQRRRPKALYSNMTPC